MQDLCEVKMRIQMKGKLSLSLLLISIIFIGHPSLIHPEVISQNESQSISPDSQVYCTSFCLDNGDHCVFGTNMDNTLKSGYLYVNKRHVLKNTWDPSTAGEYVRWISRYGSVTVNFVSYQMVWSGINEAGLMISTMSLNGSRGPAPDERPPFQSPFWMQYQLDSHSTIDQVIASDSEIRVPESQIDHYLVCDRTGACAVIEFLDGRMLVHAGEELPVKVLTNSTYEISLQAKEEIRLGGGEDYDNSIQRFVTAAERLSAYAASDSVDAVDYSFDTLKEVSREDTAWSFVYDPENLSVYFKSYSNPQIRTLHLKDLDFSCGTPVKLLDVHADISGDISDDIVDYSHAAGYAHASIFFTQYEGFSMSPLLVDTLVRGVESFNCQEGRATADMDLERYHPLIPPTILWAALTVLLRYWPVWGILLGLSLAYLAMRLAADAQLTKSSRLLWVLITVLLGPLGLLLYLITRRHRRRAEMAT